MAKPVPIKFGTDGWRAVIADQYTYANVRRCAAGLGWYLLEQAEAGAGLVVGYDTRFGSKAFAEVTASTLAALDIPVYLCRSFVLELEHLVAIQSSLKNGEILILKKRRG